MAVLNCDPTALAQAATCFDCTIPAGLQAAVQTYLLAVIAGGSLDPNTLMQAAAGWQMVSPATLDEVQAYLLCQIVNK